MSRRMIVLLSLLTLIIGVIAPVGAGAQETSGLTVTEAPLAATAELPAAPNAKHTAPVEVDARAINSAMDQARSAASSEGLAVSTTGFLASGLSSVIVTFDESTDAESVAAAVGGEVLVEYEHALNGAALTIPASGLKKLGAINGITGVYANEFHQLETETSPAFIGAPTAWNEAGGQGNAGSGVVVGIVDTGIWPEHPSFADDGSYATPPSTWTGTTCDFGSATPGDDPFTCNNKLIGATWSMPAYAASGLLLSAEFRSARDDNGHGTHTASTAAGNAGVDASIFGVGRGTVSGIAPHAHVAMYKACGDLGCFGSDLVAAIDSAIADGVDVINYSIGGGQSDPYNDADALAFLSALDAGIFVATSAGNSGPGANTVGSPGDAPWITTVGASTSDRAFISTITLTAPGADPLLVEGASVTPGIDTDTPVMLADATDPLCLVDAPASFDYTDKIVVCERGAIARVAKSFNVAHQGAAGMILYNPTLQGLATDNHFIPSVHLENNVGAEVLAYLVAHPDVTATFTMGTATAIQGDVMAAFSSRGGDGYLIIKPDVTAPGVQILAGHSPLPASIDGGLPGELFQSIQGTSMSSPHVAGAGALLAQIHPDWSPAQIKSALMMSAVEDGVTKEDGLTPSDFFDRGSGRIDLTRAPFVGLTMDESGANFLANQGHEWDNNLPSVWVPVLPGSITLQRTVHNESSRTSRWKLSVDAPGDVNISVPRQVRVAGNGEATFDIEIDARDVPLGELRTAELTLKKGNQTLHIPIAFKRGQAGVTIDKTCDPNEIRRWENTECTITIENTTFDTVEVSVEDRVPYKIFVRPWTIEGGEYSGFNRVTYDGALGGATPAFSVIEDPAPFGYFSLGAFGVAPFDLPANPDDGAWVLGGVNFVYDGVTHTDVIWSVNGTIEAGTASGVAASGTNLSMPEGALPNNLIAPWWTDLDLSLGGNWYVAGLSDGTNDYTVFEWENVPRFGDPASTATFQIWIQDGSDNLWFAYGPSAGAMEDGTVGAENSTGTIGDTYYYEGNGTSPWGGAGLKVETGVGTPGETHVITFDATGVRRGDWTNYVTMTSDAFAGTAIASDSGTVTKGKPWWRNTNGGGLE